jgi:hypothetical protein
MSKYRIVYIVIIIVIHIQSSNIIKNTLINLTNRIVWFYSIQYLENYSIIIGMVS